MKTLVMKISSKTDNEIIRKASTIIRSGGLVAFPTETVYGLGANAFDEEAVKKIFIAKGRPADNPTIAHIAKVEDVFTLTKGVTGKRKEVFLKLAEHFWPGPLTIVLKKSKIVPYVVTAGLDTIAIRMPNHKIALALIKESGVPIAAPSANSSGKPSPTNAQHVIEDLRGKIDAIIDGGQTSIGLESTVLDLSSEVPTILRPGKVTLEELEEVIGKVSIKVKGKVAKSPGMKYKHYSPNAQVILIEGKNRDEKIEKICSQLMKEKKRVAVIANKRIACTSFKKINSSTIMAKNLFKDLRNFDNQKIDCVIIEAVEEKGIGVAIMNRLRKTSQEH